MAASGAERVLESLSNRILELDALSDQNMNTHDFVQQMKNENTKRKTKSDVNKFKKWLKEQALSEDFENMEPNQLDLELARFFLNVRRSDNNEFEPDSLRSFQGSIHRYLSDKNYKNNIILDAQFKHSRDVLASKRKLLKQKGLGNKRLRSDSFTTEEQKILWEKSILGTGS
jgi:hypothetical protein